jgi:hypothetical protein
MSLKETSVNTTRQVAAIACVAATTLLSTAAHSAPIQYAANGHWYEFISTPVNWTQAFAAANASTFLGLQGYLATITTAGENAFVATNVANGGLAWLGGSDAGAAVNAWTWRNGPEAGQAFTYTNWDAGEPNNCCGGEDYVHINWGPGGTWNDHGGPGNPGQVNGYIIEYGAPNGVPEPMSLALVLTCGVLAVGFSRRRRA